MVNYTAVRKAIAQLERDAYAVAKAKKERLDNLAWRKAKQQLNIEELQ